MPQGLPVMKPIPTITPKLDFAEVDGLFDLQGMRTFIPGGYGAIGEAVAYAFARRGARVAIAGPRADKAEALAQALRGFGGDAIAETLDARDPASITRAADRVAEDLGGIDTLINCVGIQREQTLMDVTPDTFDEMYETNLRSAMFLAQAAARHQIEADNAREKSEEADTDTEPVSA